MYDTKNEIIKFWFKDTKPSQWFQVNKEFDETIRKKFGQIYNLAKKGLFDDWQSDEKGCLALCILYDQFPRNMFRNTPKAFETDSKARKITKTAIEKSFDVSLSIHQRMFLYMPLEHSEDIEDQKKSVELFAKMKDKEKIYYDYALRHYEVIKKFGRFPHRNLILGRSSTDIECEYLKQPDAGF